MNQPPSPGDIIRHVPRPRPSLGRLRVESVRGDSVLARSLDVGAEGAMFELPLEEVEGDKAVAEQLARIKENCASAGWDSYGAAPVSDAALAAVPRILEVIGQTPWIVPCNDGGVQFEWHSGDIDIEIAFGPDGRQCE